MTSPSAQHAELARVYVSRPQHVEAVRWTGTTLSSSYIDEFIPGKVRAPKHDQLLILAGKDGAQGWVPVPVGHWIVSMPEDRSDIWPVEDAYFRAKYTQEPDQRTLRAVCARAIAGSKPGTKERQLAERMLLLIDGDA